jgi:chromosome segregation ATPase
MQAKLIRKNHNCQGTTMPPAELSTSESGNTGKKAPANDTVQTLSRMIKDLEDQLDRMLTVNEAGERDLEQERKRRAELERKIETLEERLLGMEQHAATIEDLQAEINHLHNERSRLASTIEEFGRQMSDTTQENRKLTVLAERLRAERDDVIDELQSVEEQFERAMKMLSDMRTRFAVLAEERDALKGRMKLLEERFQQADEERNALLDEVQESKKALEEIRRSLVDACITSPRYPEQE